MTRTEPTTSSPERREETEDDADDMADAARGWLPAVETFAKVSMLLAYTTVSIILKAI